MLSGQPRLFWWSVAGAALMIVGAFGPWARVFIVTISGVDGEDGWLVVGLALIGGGMLYLFARRPRRWPLLVAAAAGALSALIVGWDGLQILGDDWRTEADEESIFGDADLVDPSWGLFVAFAGSVGLAVSALLLARNGTSQPAGPITSS